MRTAAGPPSTKPAQPFPRAEALKERKPANRLRLSYTIFPTASMVLAELAQPIGSIRAAKT